jgi:anti-sigma B factor antagonist
MFTSHNEIVYFLRAKGAVMQAVLVRAESAIVCYIHGNLDSETVAGFRACVAGIEPRRNVIFDLRRVPFVDAAGLGALLGAVRRVRENGGDAVISAPRPSVRRALHITAIDRTVDVVPRPNNADDYLLNRPAAA